jgi:branched-chain amino acid transport system ATP-binding protein
MLELQNVHARYQDTEVLRGISLKVEKKSIVSIIGPNGSGKSTILKSIAGLTNITEGKILFKKENILGHKTHALLDKGICYVNQGKTVFGNLSVKENMLIGLKNPYSSGQKKRLVEVYKKFPDLLTKQNEIAYTLSGGQRQMLALARAHMHEPTVLLLDEPSLGLSPKLQREIFSYIVQLRNKGLAIVLVEQNAKKAIEIANYVYVLENGVVALEGTSTAMQDNQLVGQIYLGVRGASQGK